MHSQRLPRFSRWILVILVISLLLYAAVRWLALASQTNRFQWIGTRVDRVETSEKLVALTFDDGPRGKVTQDILATLNRYQVKATFFLVGRQIKQFPLLTQQLWQSGHQLANHSFQHRAMDDEDWRRYTWEISDTDALIRKSGYQAPIHFRAPMGKKRLLLPIVLAWRGQAHILWDVNPHDYQGTAPDIMVQTVLNKVKPGSIVLLHDRDNTLAALPGMIEGLKAKGYRLVTVDQLMAAAQH